MRFKNKIALVTGTNAGIGKKIIEVLSKEGCKIIATTRKGKEGKNTKSIHYLALDVTKENEWKETIKFVKQKFGKLNILINNVGGGGRWGDEDMITTNDDVWEHVYYKNFIVSNISPFDNKIKNIIPKFQISTFR